MDRRYDHKFHGGGSGPPLLHHLFVSPSTCVMTPRAAPSCEPGRGCSPTMNSQAARLAAISNT